MADEYWIAGLAYSPLPGRASPRRRFIKSPLPPLPLSPTMSPATSPPLPSPPMTPNSTTPPPPQRPKSRHQRQASASAGRERRIMLRELLPRILATPPLEGQPEDMSRFARLQTLALHIFQDPCAFDQEELGRFLAQPLALDALRGFSDAVLDAWTRAAPAAIRIPPNSPIRIVDPGEDLSHLEASPLELCSAATCACLLWTNLHPERWLQLAKASLERGGGAFELTAEVTPDPLDPTMGVTRSGLSVALVRVKEGDATRIRIGLQPWQKASHPGLLPLFGVREDEDGLSLVCAAAPRDKLRDAPPKTVNDAYRLMRSLAKALRYLHQLRPPLVHGSVRPEAVLVTANGDSQLAESGLAKILEDCSVPGDRTLPAGALRYTAPELFGENRTLARRTARSDVYAFGCVLFEVFAGEPPFADVPEARVPRALYDGHTLRRPPSGQGLGVGDELWALIQRCCAFDLSRRMPMSQVVSALANARHADAGDSGKLVSTSTVN
ncbi:kinase-like protein [Auricularia subglabra TFB-10046 SS5]|nr:kinase-like protein [Auricularia subglabra TFB-10046 SS5]